MMDMGVLVAGLSSMKAMNRLHGMSFVISVPLLNKNWMKRQADLPLIRGLAIGICPT
jgi:hypothetical protein